jgi:hypothetical protein
MLESCGLAHLAPVFVAEKLELELLPLLEDAMLSETLGMKLGERIKFARGPQPRASVIPNAKQTGRRGHDPTARG